ncbi:MAG: HEAT repeat domain-containing protein [Bacteroidota bacterium]|nr:HEAT repeat domain-containing protein [Bacteroidota bacterium]
MKKEDYKTMLLLSMYDELNEEEQSSLDKYLKTHPDLKSELVEWQKFKSLITENMSGEASEKLLMEARQQLRSTIRNDRQKASFVNQGFALFEKFLQPAYALIGVGLVGLGMVIGYFAFSSRQGLESVVFQSKGNSDVSSANSPKISNVRFIEANTHDGQIEFEFDAVSPMRVKGKIDDPQVQKILTHALLDESNTGVRISTVNAIGRQTEKTKSVDPVIKSALVKSLQTDENPGVRREALRVLQQYPFDNEIRDALLSVLSHDKNSGMRVAAVNAFEIARMDGNVLDQESIKKLKQHMQKEQNNYVRNREVNLVKEIYQ